MNRKVLNISRWQIATLSFLTLLIIALLVDIVSVVYSQAGQAGQKEATGAIPWNLHFEAVPVGDDSLLIVTEQVAELNGDVSGGVSIGGAPRTGFLMSYDKDEERYEGTAGQILIPGARSQEGTVALTATEDGNGGTLETSISGFRRYWVPNVGAGPVVSIDNLLEMVVGDNNLGVGVYVAVMANNVAPGSLPIGYQMLGSSYSVRAGGANPTSPHPMSLKMSYTETTLAGADPHSLIILGWDPVAEAWSALEGNLNDLIDKSFATATTRFGSYVLAAGTRWRDMFTDFTGLSERSNTTIFVAQGLLVLDGLSLSGSAVSRSIEPTTEIESWGTVAFEREVPAGTSLVIDVIDEQGNVILGDIESGTSLAGLDSAIYPSLKLQATFATNDAGNSPSLDEWTVDWVPQRQQAKVYLPLIMHE